MINELSRAIQCIILAGEMAGGSGGDLIPEGITIWFKSREAAIGYFLAAMDAAAFQGLEPPKHPEHIELPIKVKISGVPVLLCAKHPDDKPW